MPLFRVYHYGEHKWDKYLLDVQETLKVGNLASGQAEGKALEVLHGQTEELRRQATQLEEIGQVLETGFEALRADFEWGFTLIADRMTVQINQLANITSKLDAIRGTLQSPLLTEARELYQLGQEHFRRGLLDKALMAYLRAEEKYDVDFLLQLQIGKLYLYGRDEDDNVINLSEAERHLLLAARYANAEKGILPNWNRYCGEAYFHAAVAAYLLGEEGDAGGASRSKRNCLEQSLNYLAKAAVLWPRFAEIIYLQAKCHALLGQYRESTQRLEMLADRDRRYFEKARLDEDLSVLGATIEAVFTASASVPGPLARATTAKIDSLQAVLALVRKLQPVPEDETSIEFAEREIFQSRAALATLNVDIEGMSERLDQLRLQFDQVTQRAFERNITACRQQILACQQSRALLVSAKRNSEESIAMLKSNPQHQSGEGAAYLFCFVGLIGAIVLVRLLLSEPPVPLQIVAAIIGWVVGGVLKDPIVDWRHNTTVKNEALLAIDQYSREIHASWQEEENWKMEMQRFEAWRSKELQPESRTA